MGSYVISNLARRIIGQYDHNRNGVIDRAAYRQPETEREHMVHTPDSLQITQYSRERLFAAADANGDGRVTPGEMERTLRRFDRNGDGKLTSRSTPWDYPNEYEAFGRAYPENVRAVFEVAKPPMPPIQPPYMPYTPYTPYMPYPMYPQVPFPGGSPY